MKIYGNLSLKTIKNSNKIHVWQFGNMASHPSTKCIKYHLSMLNILKYIS